jgi:hypothetical protein
MKNKHLTCIIAALLLFGTAVLSEAATNIYTDMASWEAAVSDIEVLTTTADNMALADEVNEPPRQNEGLGSTLTFQSIHTGLSRSFKVQSTESLNMEHDNDWDNDHYWWGDNDRTWDTHDSTRCDHGYYWSGSDYTWCDHDNDSDWGNHNDGGFIFNASERWGPSIENFRDALSLGHYYDFEDDDWRLALLNGDTMTAFGFEILNARYTPGESITLYHNDEPIETIDLESLHGTGNDTYFIGIISDAPFDRIDFKRDTDRYSIAIADFRFARLVPPSQSHVFIDFGSEGLWEYQNQDRTWTELHSNDIEHIVASGSKLAVDFGSGIGLWEYDGDSSSWTRLSTSDPDNTGSTMVAYDGGYAVDFGSGGLWHYKDAAWTKLHSNDVEHIMASGSKLIIDFGAGAGLWEYDGDSSSWTRLSISDPDNTGNTMVAYDGGYAVDFGALGLWTYNNGASMKLHNSDVEHIMASGSKLIIDFGAGAGLWEYDGDSSSWTRLSISDPDNTGNTIVAYDGGYAVDFGSGGLWHYKDATWTKLHNNDVEHIMAVDSKLLIDFGAGVGLWEYDADSSSWIRLSNADPDNTGNTMVNAEY